MKNLARLTHSSRKKVIAQWPAVAACATRKEAVWMANTLKDALSPPEDWDVERGRVPRKYCVVVPPQYEQHARLILRGAGFKGVF